MIRCALFLLFGVSLFGQTLPSFAGESLAGKKFTMPGAVNGHPALLVVCFTQASGPHCTESTNRLESDFKNNAELEIYTAIFLEDAPKLARVMTKHGIKSAVAKEDYDHYLIVMEHEKDVKAVLHFQEPDDAYLMVLGPDGTVRWTTHGPVNDDAVGKIRELVR
jgi:hypothetical protein